MIRWYDYVFAVLAADFMMGNIALALLGDMWWKQLIGGLAAYMLWDLWTNSYCKWRLTQEIKNDRN